MPRTGMRLSARTTKVAISATAMDTGRSASSIGENGNGSFRPWTNFFLNETGGETPTDYILKKNNLSTA
jgi:hypothetical protein